MNGQMIGLREHAPRRQIAAQTGWVDGLAFTVNQMHVAWAFVAALNGHAGCLLRSGTAVEKHHVQRRPDESLIARHRNKTAPIQFQRSSLAENAANQQSSVSTRIKG